jgi:hypothetical protein
MFKALGSVHSTTKRKKRYNWNGEDPEMSNLNNECSRAIAIWKTDYMIKFQPEPIVNKRKYSQGLKLTWVKYYYRFLLGYYL